MTAAACWSCRLLFVAGLSTFFVIFLVQFPGLIIRTLFGSDFHRAGAGVEQLLAMNAIATAVYAVCVVLMTMRRSATNDDNP